MSLTNEEVQQIHSMFKEGYNKDFIYKAVKLEDSNATRKEVRLEAKHLESNESLMNDRTTNMKEVRERRKIDKNYVKNRENGYLYRQSNNEIYYERIRYDG